jgi:acyl carrier protein
MGPRTRRRSAADPSARPGMMVMTTNDEQLFREVCALLERYRPPEVQLTRSTELSGDLNIDSVAAMDLIMEIEDKFGIDIPINLVSDLRNLGDLLEVVRQQIEGR